MEAYAGGDLIRGMMNHWSTAGMIPTTAVRAITKQMWESTAYMHSKSCVHRDIKADNFLMENPDVKDPNNRLYLSDFGTVVEIKQGERLSESCGTKIYWSPEFYMARYGLKVDCFAVGVLMFGLYHAKFPFKTFEETTDKRLRMDHRVPREGQELCLWALHHDEDKRCHAAQALAHAFIANVTEASVPSNAENN